jgi:uncharacterized SAM-binding protein YcdF (DUF218 family)
MSPRLLRTISLPRLILIALLLAVFGIALYGAPGFLACSDKPVKSDAVVLFLGGEEGAREKESYQLVREGYADYLIIPARGHVYKRNPDGQVVRIDLELPMYAPNQQTNKQTNSKHWFIEDTQREAIIARDIMERVGISVAILVSSPYHMRRIRIIGANVFKTALSAHPFKKDGQREFQLYTVPTRYETIGDSFWIISSYESKFVLTEYAKIAWFLLYSSFFLGRV